MMFCLCSQMPRRFQRSDVPPDEGAILDALGICRKVMVGALSKVRINGPVYVAAAAVIKAIDGLAAALTGDPQFFWDKGSAMTAQQRELAARKGDAGP
jgi:hypothetical protein